MSKPKKKTNKDIKDAINEDNEAIQGHVRNTLPQKKISEDLIVSIAIDLLRGYRPQQLRDNK